MQPDQPVLEKPSDSRQGPTSGQVALAQGDPSASSESVNNAAHHPSQMATTDDLRPTSDLDPSKKTEGLLTDFAMQQLQLRSQPFIGASADGELFADELIYSHINEIRQTIINGDQLIMLVGELGAGKSTLLKQLTKTSGQRLQFFSVKGGEKYTTHNLFNGILNAWQLDTPAEFEASVSKMLEALQAGHERNRVIVLLLDDVDQIPARELNLLIASMGYFNADDVLIHMVMSAEPAFEQQIESLLQQDLEFGYSRINVEPMLASRAHPYIQLRLNQAGHFDEFPLTEKQVTAIANDASGLPGRINFLTAETLNTQFSPFGDPVEQEKSRQGLKKQRLMRYTLGLLALGLIITGLLWKSSDNSGDAPFKTVARTPVGNSDDSVSSGAQNNSATTLQSVTKEVSDASDENATTASTDASDATQAETDSAQTSATNDAASNAINDEQASETLEAASKEISAAVNESSDDETASGSDTQAQSSVTPTETETAATQAAESAAANTASTTVDATDDSQTTEESATTSTQEQQEQTSVADVSSDSGNDSDAEVPTQTTAETNEETTANEARPDDVDGLESPNWVLLQQADKFTIQLSASTDRADVTRFLARAGLSGPNSIYSFQRQGVTRYALVHGLFDNVDQAQLAIQNMAPAAVSNQPWIRRLSSIQRSAKN